MMMERVIFAIDNDQDQNTTKKFFAWVDQKRALGQMAPMEMCIGSYKGQLERSYIILANDIEHVKDYIKGQESILRVSGDTRQPCVLEFLATGEVMPLGPMREVQAHEAMMHDAWTFCNGKYFVCAE
jgi:hypothetical protein